MENDKDLPAVTTNKIKVNCSACGKEICISGHVAKKTTGDHHICPSCSRQLAELDKGGTLSKFVAAVDKEFEKLDENNALSEKIAKDMTEENIDGLLSELLALKNTTKEELITESFFRGAWATLFLIANNHERGFLRDEAIKIKDFHNKTKNNNSKSKNQL